MRRRIELYIGGQLADLDEQGLILYNYAFTDLESPAAVKNAYSKQVNLPATPRNLAIFGHPERPERTTAYGSGTTGVDFNAGKKTPFQIYDELGQVLEGGYLRLDEVKAKGRIATGLSVTLFGGLGSFLYSLSYNEDGTKKTLADLDFGVTLENFTINRAHILAAWERLRTHSQADGIVSEYDVVNFAPAYNGIPEGNFDPAKAIINPSDCGLATSVTDGDKTYTTSGGKALLTMPEGHDEWAMKDLRSYLQRPVLSMRAFLEACARSANNGGYSVDISQIPADTYVGVWKTLPTLSSLGATQKEEGTIAATGVGSLDPGVIGTLTPSSAIPTGADVGLDITTRLAFTMEQTGLSLAFSLPGTGMAYHLVYFVQLVALTGNNIIAASRARCLCADFGQTSAEIANLVGFTPYGGAGFYDREVATPVLVSGAAFRTSQTFRFQLPTSVKADTYALVFKCYQVVVAGGNAGSLGEVQDFAAYNTSDRTLVTTAATNFNTLSGNFTYASPSEVRSGASIAYATLLASAHTPAEYLLSFAKINGLVFGYNPAERAVTILPRDSWFSGEITDLSGRVDRTKEITIRPLALKSKWYEMRGSIVAGALAEEYAKKYGVRYAIQRVNTGYDFDAAAEDLLPGVVFKSAVTLLDSGPYWNIMLRGQFAIPSVLQDAGLSYTLWDGTGEGKDFAVPSIPQSAVDFAYYNTTNKGYDKAGLPKLEFRTSDGKPLAGEDVLCRFAGSVWYEYFRVTDDSAEMLAMNNGKPCWDLASGATDIIRVPIFHRYNALQSSPIVTRSLDYGIPREVDIPGVAFDLSAASVYLRSWRAYLEDLLSVNTKVMRCRVDLGGLQVGQGLLRRFYWYEGSLWVLNKITNYSLTTWDPTECEFVQVRDAANYTSGQNL